MTAERATLASVPGGLGQTIEPGEEGQLGAASGMGGGLRAALHRWRKLPQALNARVQLRSADSLGPYVTLRGRARVSNDGRLTIGNRVRLDSTLAPLELATFPGGHLEIGDGVFVNFGSSLVSAVHVKIGDNCLIGTHVMIMDTNFHRVEDKAWDLSGKPIVLEDRVWLGNRSMVLQGVTIGHDAVVAAGSVVTRNVPPRSVVAGVPARVVRRF